MYRLFRGSSIALERAMLTSNNQQGRPAFVTKAPGPMTKSSCQAYVERTSKHKRSIPPDLSFENIVQNKAMPPCSRQDFMVAASADTPRQAKIRHSILTFWVGVPGIRLSRCRKSAVLAMVRRLFAQVLRCFQIRASLVATMVQGRSTTSSQQRLQPDRCYCLRPREPSNHWRSDDS